MKYRNNRIKWIKSWRWEGEGNSAAAEPREIVSELRNILNQTIQAQKQQNYAEDDALATIAYLDNFEFIEAPLAEKDNA